MHGTVPAESTPAASIDAAQAVRDVIGREVKDGEVFAVVPRSEWRNGLDH